jgi:hypothetical protein
MDVNETYVELYCPMLVAEMEFDLATAAHDIPAATDAGLQYHRQADHIVNLIGADPRPSE